MYIYFLFNRKMKLSSLSIFTSAFLLVLMFNHCAISADKVAFNDSNVISEEIKNNSVNINSTISCILNKTYSNSPVEVVNASKLALLLQVEPNVTNRQIPGSCVGVLFYSPSCPFSCTAAPHFNALQKFFPDIKMVAVNARKYRSFNAQFGIVGTPTLMLFHSGRPAVKFSDTSEYGLEVFANFIKRHTGIEPTGTLVVTAEDYKGPVESVQVNDFDYCLMLSCIVIAAKALHSIFYSSWGRHLFDPLIHAWREAELQHIHAD